jgi:hypothetical protein
MRPVTRKASAGPARPPLVRPVPVTCLPVTCLLAACLLALSCAPAAAQTMRERMNAPDAFRQDPAPLAPGSGIDASRPFSQPLWQSVPPDTRPEPEERRPLKPLFVPPVKPQR